MALTQITDVIVPEIFGPYVQQLTEEKSRLIQSGALARSATLDGLLAGGGLTFNFPSWRDLANDADAVVTDEAAGVNDLVAKKTQASNEIAVRLSRAQAWATADLTEALAGSDPMQSIANRVADYWDRRLQSAFVATWNGVFADNDAAPSGSEHVQFDLRFDASGGSYVPGVTNFTAENFINAAVTMGDSMEDLTMIMVHSTVYARMQKNNLIDFIPDARGEVNIPTFHGRQVIVDDGMPFSGSVYESWLFSAGATQLGVGSPRVPVEVDRKPEAGQGGGEERLFNRVELCLHPRGHKYAGTAPNGGPSNAATSNNLAAAGSWERVYPERKQIKVARLITREA